MMGILNNLKIIMFSMVLLITVAACGSSSTATTATTVNGLSTAENTQLLNE